MAASNKEERRSEGSTRFDLGGALLDEAVEGGEPCAGADHNHGNGLDVKGWVECLMALLNGHAETVSFFELGEVVAGDADVAFPTPGKGILVQDPVG